MLNFLKTYGQVTVIFLSLLISFIVMSYALVQTESMILQQRIYSVAESVNYICDEFEYHVNVLGEEVDNHVDALVNIITKLDRKVGVYAEILDRDYVGLTERYETFPQAPLIIQDYRDFIAYTKNGSHGHYDLWFEHPNIKAHTVYLNYRWVFQHSDQPILIILGISNYGSTPQTIQFTDLAERMLMFSFALLIVSLFSFILNIRSIRRVGAVNA